MTPFRHKVFPPLWTQKAFSLLGKKASNCDVRCDKGVSSIYYEKKDKVSPYSKKQKQKNQNSSMLRSIHSRA